MHSPFFTSVDSFAPNPPFSAPLKGQPLPPPAASPQKSTFKNKNDWRRSQHPLTLHSNPLTQNQLESKFPRCLSEKTRHLIQHTISKCWAASTTNKYSNTIRLFFKFCDLENIPNHLRFPTDEFILCAFAASGAGNSSFKTVHNKIAALKAWHFRHDAEWKGGMRLHLVLNGVKNLAPKSSSKPPRPPINAKMLNQLIDGLDLSDPLDAAVAACATVAFWGQCRLGELLPASHLNLSTTAIPSRTNIRRSSRNTHSYLLFLPQTKIRRNGEEIVLTTQLGKCDPLKMLHNHLNINNLHHRLPLFAYTSSSGPRTLSKRRFLARCNSIWSNFGYPRTTGHCFRISSTTELLLAGVPPDVVKTLGRWSSDSFLRYWRFLEDIAPRYTRKLDYRHTSNLKRKRKDSL